MIATKSRPQGDLEAAESCDGDKLTISPVEPLGSYRFEAIRGRLGQFAARMLEEAFAVAMPAVWERRAGTLDDARPKPNDFTGRATVDELTERDNRLAEQAEACRNHAKFLRAYPDVLADLVAVDAETLMGVTPDGEATT